jgi:hypothetical protein
MRARRVIGGLGLVGLGGLVWLGLAVARNAGSAPAREVKTTIAAAVSAGRHVRIDGPRGAIHVWIPPGYRADTGATVLYVHGYFDDVDTSWVGHQLPEQFALAATNALLVAPEAPVAQKLPINYPDLGELLRLVEDHTGVTRGAALTVAIGHSGAFRTLQAWLDEPLLDQLVMIDAMYGDEELIATWLRASPRRRLITVGEDTILGTESFAARFPAETITIDRVPPAYELWPIDVATLRAAKHVYLRAQYEHMPLVTEGIVLPAVLRLLPIEPLATLPWQLPLGSLPPLPDAAVDAPVD